MLRDGGTYLNKAGEIINITQDCRIAFLYPFVDQHGRRYTFHGVCDDARDWQLGLSKEYTEPKNRP
jgi:hypothetical protein